jgi:hypothetical protein
MTRQATMAWCGAMVLLLSGCSFVQEKVVDTQLFRQHILACTEAIQSGDLDQAEVHLAAARPLARTEHQKQQLQSLTELIAGAEAMFRGDDRMAKAHFSRIADPYLRREVRTRARDHGLDVPLEPVQ